MLRHRGRTGILLPILLFTLPLSATSCADEESAAEEAPVEEAAIESPPAGAALGQLQETEAGAALAAALAQAANTDRLVFLHTGADW